MLEAAATPLISPAELQGQLTSAAPPLVIDGRATHDYMRGLIPGAVHLDLWGVSLIDTNEAPLRAFMWMIGHLFSQRGVSADRAVVVCDNDSGLRAARLYWFLEYLGHPDVRVLDGGISAWTASGRPLTTTAAPPVTSTWHGAEVRERLATWQDVRATVRQPDVALVDTRSREEYTGRMIRARRGGAIPGAIHLEWKQNLTADGRYKSVDELRPLYEAVGVTPDKTVITYCQGGYRAAHTYLALRVLGFTRIRNYTGSWKEWGDREDLPIEQPEAPEDDRGVV